MAFAVPGRERERGFPCTNNTNQSITGSATSWGDRSMIDRRRTTTRQRRVRLSRFNENYIGTSNVFRIFFLFLRRGIDGDWLWGRLHWPEHARQCTSTHVQWERWRRQRAPSPTFANSFEAHPFALHIFILSHSSPPGFKPSFTNLAHMS